MDCRTEAVWTEGLRQCGLRVLRQCGLRVLRQCGLKELRQCELKDRGSVD